MIETDEKRGGVMQNAIFVKHDIDRQNELNKPLYSPAKITVAEHVRSLAIGAHRDGGRVYPPNYRKTEICIKAEGARARDMLSPEWPAFDAYCVANDVTKKITKRGDWIYSIK